MTIAHNDVTKATEAYITSKLQESVLFEDSLQSTTLQLQAFPLEQELISFLTQYTHHSVQAKLRLKSLITALGLDLQHNSTRLFDLIWQDKVKFIQSAAKLGGADFLLCMLVQQLSFLKVANFTTLCIYYRSVSHFGATEILEQLQLAEQEQQARITTLIASKRLKRGL